MRTQDSKYLRIPRVVEVTLGVPGLGKIKEIYNLDEPGDCQAWDLNTANGCMTLGIVFIYEDKNPYIVLY